ncbi:major tail protein [Facklamia lactis]|uniref:major tail protein n=1 Tax=Facklamia lactis TaxID=2749967 RepID=UPI0018CF39E6|nr:major tail protein [Facklamia lactis]MBG9980443.1 phage tail protein [Facklamia lactis]
MKNKVKFNISKVHYALITVTDEGFNFGIPVPMPGAVSISLAPNGEPESFYADGIEYYTISNNMGYDGDLEIALIPESFRTDILKEATDANKVLIENANIETANFALLFEFDGDKRKIRHVMYNCTAARPSLEGQTNEESREVQHESLSLSSRPLPNGLVKARTGNETGIEAYNGWYTQVYLPVEETEGA